MNRLGLDGKSLGIVDVDLYTPGLNFVFGVVSALGGKLGVVSTARLREEFYGASPNESLFKERLEKEVIHELGHLFGFKHCPDPYCVMHFSNSLRDTDIKLAEFCEKCKKKF